MNHQTLSHTLISSECHHGKGIIVVIHTCTSLQSFISSANRSAYEKVSTSCSVFNTALCKGLQQKLDIVRLGPFIIEGKVTIIQQYYVCDPIALLEEMYRHNQTKHGLEYQRPDIVTNMRPSDITLHEEIMKESWTTPPFDAKEYVNMYGKG